MKLLLKVIVKDAQGVPANSFDVQLCIITFLAFAILYELLVTNYFKAIRRMTLKEIMLAE